MLDCGTERKGKDRYIDTPCNSYMSLHDMRKYLLCTYRNRLELGKHVDRPRDYRQSDDTIGKPSAKDALNDCISAVREVLVNKENICPPGMTFLYKKSHCWASSCPSGPSAPEDGEPDDWWIKYREYIMIDAYHFIDTRKWLQEDVWHVFFYYDVDQLRAWEDQAERRKQ